MGHVMSNNLDLMATGSSIRSDRKLAEAVDNMLVLANKSTKLTRRETLHVRASEKLARG